MIGRRSLLLGAGAVLASPHRLGASAPAQAPVDLVLNGAWWATTFAGICILATVLALNVLA
ncbi:MAG: hypothetical protein ACK46X_22470, partial [Candidatus Sericytochromatia bacterium]